MKMQCWDPESYFGSSEISGGASSSSFVLLNPLRLFSSLYIPFLETETGNMATYLDTIGKSFVNVKITEEGVDTVGFLEAADGVPALFDLLGSTAFALVKGDITGNIAKVRARYLAHPDKSKTLEELVENEKGEKKRTATEGLMWLLRGLQFTYLGLKASLANKTEELTASFTGAYDKTLKQYHNFVVKGTFSLAMKACPYRKDFYEKLGSPLEKVEVELGKWLEALEVIVLKEQTFYEKHGHNKGF